LAGYSNQTGGSIVINASGAGITGNNVGTYINPVRVSSSTSNALYFDSVNSEITYNASTRKYKTNIIDLSQNTENIYGLQPREYDFIPDNTHMVGFIAEEAFDKDKYFATLNTNGEVENINWNGIITYLVAEIKKLKIIFNNEINELKLKIEILENKI
jgi:hypothetical protein